MKRAPVVLIATAAGLAGLATFRTRPVASNALTSPLSLSAGQVGNTHSTTSTTPASLPSTTSPVTNTPASTSTTTTPSANDPSSSHPVSTTTTTTPTQSSTAPTTLPQSTTTTTLPPTTTTSPSGTRTATGSVITYGYGTLSVEVTVNGHTITKISMASLNDGGNFRSQSIDNQSIPILEQEVLQAQSANIQSVSGASYTSQGFQQSLQNALSQLGF